MATRPMKTCNVCRLTTSLDGFYRNRAQLDGYDHACKKCKNEQNARYSDRKGYQRSYYLKNKERILDSQKARQLRDKEAYLEYRREYKKKYLKTLNGILHNRRQSSKRRSYKSEPYNFTEILQKYDSTCILCKSKIDITIAWPDPRSLTVEHIIPLALGGTDTADNVAPAHFHCNIANSASIKKEVQNV